MCVESHMLGMLIWQPRYSVRISRGGMKVSRAQGEMLSHHFCSHRLNDFIPPLTNRFTRRDTAIIEVPSAWLSAYIQCMVHGIGAFDTLLPLLLCALASRVQSDQHNSGATVMLVILHFHTLVADKNIFCFYCSFTVAPWSYHKGMYAWPETTRSGFTL